MSIARAFTTRRVRQTLELKDNANSDNIPHRSRTTKAFGVHGSIRHKISAPVELTHTTNMLSYNAPDIFPHASNAAATSSSSSSGKSDDESDSGATAASTPPTSPDTPFPDDKQRAMSPEPNHLSCYFTPPRASTSEYNSNVTAVASPANTSPVATPSAAFPASEAPAIPQRAPSHTKKASYEGLTRHRSLSRMSEQSTRSLSTKASFSFSRSSSSSTSTSVTSTSHISTMKPSFHGPSASVSATSNVSAMVGPTPPVSHKKEYSESHPFGHELAKVSELVEEFGKEDTLHEEPAATKSNPVVDEEERELVRQGLKKFSAEDYLSEIHGLMSSFFAESRPLATVWI